MQFQITKFGHAVYYQNAKLGKIIKSWRKEQHRRFLMGGFSYGGGNMTYYNSRFIMIDDLYILGQVNRLKFEPTSIYKLNGTTLEQLKTINDLPYTKEYLKNIYEAEYYSDLQYARKNSPCVSCEYISVLLQGYKLIVDKTKSPFTTIIEPKTVDTHIIQILEDQRKETEEYITWKNFDEDVFIYEGDHISIVVDTMTTDLIRFICGTYHFNVLNEQGKLAIKNNIAIDIQKLWATGRYVLGYYKEYMAKYDVETKTIRAYYKNNKEIVVADLTDRQKDELAWDLNVRTLKTLKRNPEATKVESYTAWWRQDMPIYFFKDRQVDIRAVPANVRDALAKNRTAEVNSDYFSVEQDKIRLMYATKDGIALIDKDDKELDIKAEHLNRTPTIELLMKKFENLGYILGWIPAPFFYHLEKAISLRNFLDGLDDVNNDRTFRIFFNKNQTALIEQKMGTTNKQFKKYIATLISDVIIQEIKNLNTVFLYLEYIKLANSIFVLEIQ